MKAEVGHDKVCKALVMILCLLIVFMFFLSKSKAAEVSIGVVSTEDLYARMQAQFIIGEKSGDYTKAMTLYEQNPQLKDFKDAEKYYRYMCGWKCIWAEDMSNANLLFHSLGEFLDSGACCAYSRGRIAESEGRYEDAVSDYLEAASVPIEDSIKRMLECNTHVDDEKKSTLYTASLREYEMAIEQKDAAKITELRNVFAALGGYSDAALYVSQCDAWLKKEARRVSVSVSDMTEALQISWTDNEPGHKYHLFYRPENCRNTEKMSLCISPVSLTGLIPNTAYEIIVQDAADMLVQTVVTATTSTVPKVQSDMMTLVKMQLSGIPRTLINDPEIHVSPNDIFIDYPELLLEKENNLFTSRELLSHSLYVSILYKNTTGREQEAAVSCVLRSASFGTYQLQQNTFTLPDITDTCMFCISADALLSVLQEDYGAFPPDTYACEVYVNHLYLGSVEFTIQ